jgi:hypothetical protein
LCGKCYQLGKNFQTEPCYTLPVPKRTPTKEPYLGCGVECLCVELCEARMSSKVQFKGSHRAVHATELCPEPAFVMIIIYQ